MVFWKLLHSLLHGTPLALCQSQRKKESGQQKKTGEIKPSRRSPRERSKISVQVAGSSDSTNLGSKGEKRVFSAE